MHPSGRFLVMRYRFLSACASVYQCLFRLRQCSPGRDAFCPSHRSSPNGDSPEPELQPATPSTGHDGYCGSLLSFRPAFLSKCSRRFSVSRKIALARVVLCHVATALLQENCRPVFAVPFSRFFAATFEFTRLDKNGPRR